MGAGGIALAVIVAVLIGLSEIMRASGHPHKLNPVVDGQRPTDPLLTMPDSPPNGLGWNDIAFVLGGFGWKVRFITGEEGEYQVVTGTAVQWNIPTEEWVAYHDGEDVAYNYGCFVCHTTGPDEISDTFREPGVRCEVRLRAGAASRQAAMRPLTASWTRTRASARSAWGG